MTETIRLTLIDSLLQRRERRVGTPEIALDGAKADAELFGDGPLRNTVDAVPAKDRRRAGTEGIERGHDQPRLLTADQVTLGRRRIGDARDGAVVRLAPFALAPPRLPGRAEAVDHQGVSRAE